VVQPGGHTFGLSSPAAGEGIRAACGLSLDALGVGKTLGAPL
jgi:hypothetical protein